MNNHLVTSTMRPQQKHKQTQPHSERREKCPHRHFYRFVPLKFQLIWYYEHTHISCYRHCSINIEFLLIMARCHCFFFTHSHTHMPKRPHNFYSSNWIPHPPKIMCWFSDDANRRQWLWTSNFLPFGGTFDYACYLWLYLSRDYSFFRVKNYDQTQTPKFWGRRKNRKQQTSYI